MSKRPQEQGLECLWFGDGAWYDIDIKRTCVKSDAACGPYLLVYYQHDQESNNDKDVLLPDEIPSRVRFASEPVQDSNCSEVKEGDIVSALYATEDEVKYYSAEVVRADRQDHGCGDGDCTCSFTLKWLPPYTTLPPEAAAKVPTGHFKADIGELCFFTGYSFLHPRVKKWMDEIERHMAKMAATQPCVRSQSPLFSPTSPRSNDAADALMELLESKAGSRPPSTRTAPTSPVSTPLKMHAASGADASSMAAKCTARRSPTAVAAFRGPNQSHTAEADGSAGNTTEYLPGPSGIIHRPSCSAAEPAHQQQPPAAAAADVAEDGMPATGANGLVVLLQAATLMDQQAGIVAQGGKQEGKPSEVVGGSRDVGEGHVPVHRQLNMGMPSPEQPVTASAEDGTEAATVAASVVHKSGKAVAAAAKYVSPACTSEPARFSPAVAAATAAASAQAAGAASKPSVPAHKSALVPAASSMSAAAAPTIASSIPGRSSADAPPKPWSKTKTGDRASKPAASTAAAAAPWKSLSLPAAPLSAPARSKSLAAPVSDALAAAASTALMATDPVVVDPRSTATVPFTKAAPAACRASGTRPPAAAAAQPLAVAAAAHRSVPPSAPELDAAAQHALVQLKTRRLQLPSVSFTFEEISTIAQMYKQNKLRLSEQSRNSLVLSLDSTGLQSESRLLRMVIDDIKAQLVPADSHKTGVTTAASTAGRVKMEKQGAARSDAAGLASDGARAVVPAGASQRAQPAAGALRQHARSDTTDVGTAPGALQSAAQAAAASRQQTGGVQAAGNASAVLSKAAWQEAARGPDASHAQHAASSQQPHGDSYIYSAPQTAAVQEPASSHAAARTASTAGDSSRQWLPQSGTELAVPAAANAMACNMRNAAGPPSGAAPLVGTSQLPIGSMKGRAEGHHMGASHGEKTSVAPQLTLSAATAVTGTAPQTASATMAAKPQPIPSKPAAAPKKPTLLTSWAAMKKAGEAAGAPVNTKPGTSAVIADAGVVMRPSGATARNPKVSGAVTAAGGASALGKRPADVLQAVRVVAAECNRGAGGSGGQAWMPAMQQAAGMGASSSAAVRACHYTAAAPVPAGAPAAARPFEHLPSRPFRPLENHVDISLRLVMAIKGYIEAENSMCPPHKKHKA